MVTFGSKAGSNIRRDLKAATGDGNFLKTVQDGKDLRVRFLQNPEDWYGFREHYSQATKFFPCTQDETCPGCTSDSEQLKRSSKRYVASVLDVAQGKVVPLKMPVDLANRVTNKCDRNHGTLLDRDFTLIRTGKGMNDTTYDVEAEDKTQVDLSRYEIVDPEPILAASYAESFGEGTTKAPFDSVPGSTPMEQKKNLEESGYPAPKELKEKTQDSSTGAQVETASTSVSPTSTNEDDGGFLSLDSLKTMNEEQLRQLCTDNGIVPPVEADNAQDLLDWLLAQFGV